jgi:GTP-dependent phosphoenolpyruvate carboxykinase
MADEDIYKTWSSGWLEHLLVVRVVKTNYREEYVGSWFPLFCCNGARNVDLRRLIVQLRNNK